MENASKALIIVGAILVSILLISVGILIMNSTSGVTDQVQGQGDSSAIQMFNAQIMPYEGDYVSGTKVKELLSKITPMIGVQIKIRGESYKIDGKSYKTTQVKGIIESHKYFVKAVKHEKKCDCAITSKSIGEICKIYIDDRNVRSDGNRNWYDRRDEL